MQYLCEELRSQIFFQLRQSGEFKVHKSELLYQLAGQQKNESNSNRIPKTNAMTVSAKIPKRQDFQKGTGNA